VPARVETVVLFLPDVWSCSPTRLEWQATVSRFQSELEKKLSSSTADDDDAGHAELKALLSLLLCCTSCSVAVVAVLTHSRQITHILVHSFVGNCAFCHYLFKYISLLFVTARMV